MARQAADISVFQRAHNLDKKRYIPQIHIQNQEERTNQY